MWICHCKDKHPINHLTCPAVDGSDRHTTEAKFKKLSYNDKSHVKGSLQAEAQVKRK